MGKRDGLAKRNGGVTAVQRQGSFTLFNCFEMTEDGVIVHGEPSLSEFQGTVDFVQRSLKSSGWWLVDLIEYGESRPDFREMVDTILDHEAVPESTRRQYRYLGRALPQENRVQGVSFGHHTVVASMEPVDQGQWLERSRERGWTQQELRREIKAAARTKVIEGQAQLAGKYRVIYMDPHFMFRQGESSAGLSIEQLAALPVGSHAAEDSVLFCWVPPMWLLEKPGPRELFDAWGFDPQTQFVWDTVHGAKGHFSEVTHEFLIVATRGNCLPDAPNAIEKSVQALRRNAANYEEKPIEFRRMIEKLYTTGPYLELFGRKPVEGWTVLGNDPRRWAEQAPPHVMPQEEVPF